MATHEGALAGMTVLDLTQVMAGPFCTMILADLGADVVKVENPESGDQTRSSMTHPGAFRALNRNKRSVTLDLKSDEGRATFHELARSADAVVENWRPGVAAKLGVDYETLRALNPGLIYASVSGFGQTGPYADRPGYDLIAQAMAGVMSVTGEQGDRPVKSGIPIADLGAGLFTAVGVLAAWASRQRTGQGQYVETSLFEAAVALSVWESTEFWATGKRRRPSAPHTGCPRRTRRWPRATGSSRSGPTTSGSGSGCARPSTRRNWQATRGSPTTTTGWPTARSWWSSWNAASPPTTRPPGWSGCSPQACPPGRSRTTSRSSRRTRT
ncbi:hypothetical protein BJF90_18930 [Pseudonocardia sp. CNS-004]|nr:hypothetical protein BJF90_18930 [Pseudonocardia sp. CNS-004]